VNIEVVFFGPANAHTTYSLALVFARWAGWPLQTQIVESTIASHHNVTVGGVPFGCVAANVMEREKVTLQLLQHCFCPVNVAAMRGLNGKRLIEVCGSKMADLDRHALTAIFYLVSGEGEVTSSVRDRHNRFPSEASLLRHWGVLDLPVADILAEYLQDRVRASLLGLPPIQAAEPVKVSHDVDVPFKLAFKHLSDLPRLIAGDWLHRRRFDSAWSTLRDWLAVRQGDFERDPYNCFERILAGHDRAGRHADFYFISGHTGGRIDGDYSLDDEPIRSLINEVTRRGHRVGLHPSYCASTSADALNVERKRLDKVMYELDISVPLDAVRTHYLRFDPLQTPALLQQAGFTEDSSVAFADAAGFRRGTCRSFPLWDWERGCALNLVEKPLIAMDVSLLAPHYEGLDHDAAASRIDTLKSECQRHGGTFSLLWHNNNFNSESDFELYEYADSRIMP